MPHSHSRSPRWTEHLLHGSLRNLIECLGFEWVIATDEKGSDLAVYGCPGSGDILVFPANFIAKRWEKREINFIEKSYIQIASDVQKICQQHGGQRHHERPITS